MKVFGATTRWEMAVVMAAVMHWRREVGEDESSRKTQAGRHGNTRSFFNARDQRQRGVQNVERGRPTGKKQPGTGCPRAPEQPNH